MSETTVGERAAELLVEHGYCSRNELEGCTEEDLEALEDRYDVTLPEAYRSCMRHIGRYPGTFLRGSEFAYPEMELQTEFAKRRIEEGNTDFEFSDDAFVFHGLQGYAFDYFNTEEGEDPPVYLFTKFDNKYESRHKADSFSEWLFREIERLSSRV